MTILEGKENMLTFMQNIFIGGIKKQKHSTKQLKGQLINKH